MDASKAAAAAMAEYDANEDGKLTKDELEKAPSIKSAWQIMDPSQQGVTADMIAERIRTWQGQKLGRLTIACLVNRNGSPLEGAAVVFEPEKFMGSAYQPAEGKTDKGGVATISVPVSGADDVPGVPPGFYKVKITKAGDQIPAIYNEQTTLGVEISNESLGISSGIRFDLKY